MSWMHWLLLALLAAFLGLLPISRIYALRFGRITLLTIIAAIIVTPFVWLVCSAIKDPSVMNEHSFLPPLSKISQATVNLKNFRRSI